MKKIWDSIARDLWVVLLDVLAVNASYILALLIRFYVNNQFRPTVNYLIGDWARFAPFYTVLCILIFALFRLYGGVWRYAGINVMNRIIGASLATCVLQIVGTCLFIRRMPISYYGIGAILQFFFISVIRFGYRILLVEKKKVADRKAPTVPCMIIGAGETAKKAMHHLEDTPFRAAVVVDEKSAGKTLDGVEIKADFEAALPAVRAVFIADPNLPTDRRAKIKAKCEAAGVELRDYTGYLANLGGLVPTSSVLNLVKGPVTLVLEGKEQTFASGEEAIQSLKDRYDIQEIAGAKITLERPSSAAYAGYEAWAQQHKEQTGEDVSFF